MATSQKFQSRSIIPAFSGGVKGGFGKRRRDICKKYKRDPLLTASLSGAIITPTE
jgi:hypothetical protein